MKTKWSSIMTKYIQEEIERFICPECCGDLVEIHTVTTRGNGYISIRGCKSCFKLYYHGVVP